MQGISIFILAIATNLDNLCIGMAYGCQGKSIAMKHNVWIALISGVVSFFLCWVSSYFALEMSSMANSIGALLLIGMGIWMVIPKHDSEEPKTMQGVSVWVLGTTLAINCIPVALGAGLTGLSPLWLGMATMLFSFITVGLGNLVGCRIREKITSRLLDILSAICMLGIGIFEMICG